MLDVKEKTLFLTSWKQYWFILQFVSHLFSKYCRSLRFRGPILHMFLQQARANGVGTLFV